MPRCRKTKLRLIKEIKNAQAQLKDVEKLLKLDPSNTELVRQKQKLLADAIKGTKEKLTTLKTAAEQANEQLQKGEITQEQYDALQREIQGTEQALRSLESQASSTNATLAKIEEVGGKFEQVGQSITSAGKTLTTHVTAPIVAAGAAAVKTAADFDEGMKVAAISGATGDDLQGLRDKAREMGAKTKFSATEAASAFEYMAMAGWKLADMVDGIDGIMSLAAASGEDLATTSDIVTDALTAFGLKASDSGHFADILAAASSNANTNVSMMGEDFYWKGDAIVMKQGTKLIKIGRYKTGEYGIATSSDNGTTWETALDFDGLQGGGGTTVVQQDTIKKSAAAPASPALNDLWVDTANKRLKLWNGTAWVIIGYEPEETPTDPETPTETPTDSETPTDEGGDDTGGEAGGDDTGDESGAETGGGSDEEGGA